MRAKGSPLSVFPNRFSGSQPYPLRTLDAKGYFQPGRLQEGPVSADVIALASRGRLETSPRFSRGEPIITVGTSLRRLFARKPDLRILDRPLPINMIDLQIVGESALRAELLGMADFTHRLVPAVLEASAQIRPDVPGGWLAHLGWEASFRWYFYGASTEVISTLERALWTSAQLPTDMTGIFTKRCIEILGDVYVERGEFDIAMQLYRGAARVKHGGYVMDIRVDDCVSESKYAAIQAVRDAEAGWKTRRRRENWLIVPNSGAALREALAEDSIRKYVVVELQDFGLMELRILKSAMLYQHPDAVMSGEAVVAAGRIQLHDENPITIDGSSGNYGRYITDKHMRRALRFLQTTFPEMEFAIEGEYPARDDLQGTPLLGNRLLPPF